MFAEGLGSFVGAIGQIAVLATTLSLVPWPILEDGLEKIKKIGELLLGAIFALAISTRIAGGKSAFSLGALVAVIAGVAGALYLLGKYGDIDKYAPIAKAISDVLWALTGVIGVLGTFGGWTGGLKAGANIGEFVAVLGAIGGIFEGLDWLLHKVGVSEDFDLITSIGDVMGKLGDAIGKFIGGIGKGAVDKIREADPEAIKKLVDFIKEIAALEIPTQVEFKWDDSGISFVDKSLVSFAAGMKGIISAVNDLDTEGFNTALLSMKIKYFSAISGFVKDLAAIEIPVQTEFKWDENGISYVDQSLSSFGKGMKKVIEAVNDLEWNLFTIFTLGPKIKYFSAISDFVKDLAGIEIPVQTEFKWDDEGISYVDKSLSSFGNGMKNVVEAINKVDMTGISDKSLETKGKYFTEIGKFVEQLAGITIPPQSEFKWDRSGISFIDSSLASFATGMESVITAVNSVKFGLWDVITLKAKGVYFGIISDFVSSLADIPIPIQTSIKLNLLEGSYEHMDQSLEKFAKGVGLIVEAMNEVDDSKIDEATMRTKTDYLTMASGFVGELAKIDIPVQTNKTAILSWFGGGISMTQDNSLATFASGIKGVVEALNEMEPLKISEDDVSLAANAVKKMADAAADIPEQPGTLTKWFEDNSLSRFANEMSLSADDIVAASGKSTGISITNIAKLSMAVGLMTGIISQIATHAGVNADYVDTAQIVGRYANMVSDIGNAFANFDGLQNVSVADIHKIPDLIKELMAVDDVLEGDEFKIGSKFENCRRHVDDPFEKLKEWGNRLGEISFDTSKISMITGAIETITLFNMDTGDIFDSEIVTQFVTNVDTIKSTIEGLSGVDTSGVDKVTSAAEKLAGADLNSDTTKKEAGESGKALNKSLTDGMGDTSGVSSAMSGVTEAALSAVSGQTGSFTSAGRSLVSALVAGITSFRGTVKTAFSRAVNNGINAAKDAVTDARSLGIDFASGYANGISFNTPFVANAARAMVKSAKTAVKTEQNSSSPSKETYKLGRYFIDGYTNAIRDFSSDPSEAAREMARATIDGVSESLALAASMIEDEQYQPTITPVLDLSEIQNRASGIESLLNTSPMVSSNLGAVSINSNMRRMSTTNDDVVEALESLGGIMEAFEPGNTYNLNGITYDDGSNIASAVGEIVRAARVERRA